MNDLISRKRAVAVVKESLEPSRLIDAMQTGKSFADLSAELIRGLECLPDPDIKAAADFVAVYFLKHDCGLHFKSKGKYYALQVVEISREDW